VTSHLTRADCRLTSVDPLMGEVWSGTPEVSDLASALPDNGSRDPGDSRVRALPSPVCTARATNQGRPPKTVGDCGRRPAQQRHARWFVAPILQPLSLASPTLTCANCCPPDRQRQPQQVLPTIASDSCAHPPGWHLLGVPGRSARRSAMEPWECSLRVGQDRDGHQPGHQHPSDDGEPRVPRRDRSNQDISDNWSDREACGVTEPLSVLR
jgi:hypothetical protein